MEVPPRYQVIQESYEEYLVRNISFLGLFGYKPDFGSVLSKLELSHKVLTQFLAQNYQFYSFISLGCIFSVYGVGPVYWFL